MGTRQFLMDKFLLRQLLTAFFLPNVMQVQRNLEVIAPTNFEEQSKTVLNQKLKSLINSAPCIVFMKVSSNQLGFLNMIIFTCL